MGGHDPWAAVRTVPRPAAPAACPTPPPPRLGHRHPAPSPRLRGGQVDDLYGTKHYDALGLKPSASAADIKKAGPHSHCCRLQPPRTAPRRR